MFHYIKVTHRVDSYPCMFAAWELSKKRAREIYLFFAREEQGHKKRVAIRLTLLGPWTKRSGKDSGKRIEKKPSEFALSSTPIFCRTFTVSEKKREAWLSEKELESFRVFMSSYCLLSLLHPTLLFAQLNSTGSLSQNIFFRWSATYVEWNMKESNRIQPCISNEIVSCTWILSFRRTILTSS